MGTTGNFRAGNDPANCKGSAAEAWAVLSGVVADREPEWWEAGSRGSLFRSSRWKELCSVPTAALGLPNPHIL